MSPINGTYHIFADRAGSRFRPGSLHHAALAQHPEQVIGGLEVARSVSAEGEHLDTTEVEPPPGPLDPGWDHTATERSVANPVEADHRLREVIHRRSGLLEDQVWVRGADVTDVITDRCRILDLHAREARGGTG